MCVVPLLVACFLVVVHVRNSLAVSFTWPEGV